MERLSFGADKPKQGLILTGADSLVAEIRACTLCAGRFALTATAHEPRPVVWFRPKVLLLIAGQAPGARVHAAQEPFRDASGDRLRQWTGLSKAEFYDRDRVAVVPMAFCFPGYDATGSDLPPPPICAATWHARVMAALPGLDLLLLVGGAAQRWHLNTRAGVGATVAAWRDHAPRVFPLPHPSWRTTGWQKRHPWFAAEVVPALQQAVRAALENP